METADASLRWTRAAALAVVALLVAVWAHAGAGGRLPSAPVLVAVAVGLAVLAQPLLARPASALRVVLLTVGGQTLAHVALSLTAGHRGDPTHAAGHLAAPGPVYAPAPLALDGQGRRVGSLLDHARATPGIGDGGLTVPDPVAYLLGDLSAAGAPMVLAHLAAAALVGAWLAGGEQALWTLLTLAWRAWSLPFATVVPTTAPRRAATPVVVRPLRCRVGAGSVVRRGPPLLLAA